MNLESLDLRILELLEEQNLQQKLQKRILEISEELDSLKQGLKTSEQKMLDEKKDVERLESISIKKIFTNIMGSTAEELEKEKQEYLDAVYQYNAVVDQIEIVQYEAELLHEKKSSQISVDAELGSLIKKKEFYLKGRPGVVSQTINKYDTQLKLLKFQLNDMSEAMQAGEYARAAVLNLESILNQLYRYMNRPKQHRGMMSGFQMKQLAQQSTQVAAVVQTRLNNYEKELRDVYKSLNLSFSLDTYRHFLEQYYRFFVMSWVKRNNLRETLYNLEDIRRQIDHHQNNLIQNQKAHQSEMDELSETKRLYVINA